VGRMRTRRQFLTILAALSMWLGLRRRSPAIDSRDLWDTRNVEKEDEVQLTELMQSCVGPGGFVLRRVQSWGMDLNLGQRCS